MFRNILAITRFGLMAAIVAVAAVLGLAASASAYQTGYSNVQLVSMLETSGQCTGSSAVPDAAATITYAYAPQYPQLLLDEGLEGSAVVNFTMALDGSVSNATVAGASGNRLFDRAAVDAVKKSHFAPATQNCSKIGGIYGVEVIFTQGGGSTFPVFSPLMLGGGRLVNK